MLQLFIREKIFDSFVNIVAFAFDQILLHFLVYFTYSAYIVGEIHFLTNETFLVRAYEISMDLTKISGVSTFLFQFAPSHQI